MQAQEPRAKNFLGWKKWSSIKECHRKVREDKETRTKNVQGEGHWYDPVCLWHKKKVSERKNGWSKVQVL